MQIIIDKTKIFFKKCKKELFYDLNHYGVQMNVSSNNAYNYDVKNVKKRDLILSSIKRKMYIFVLN